MTHDIDPKERERGVAIIGMAGRFPGAADVEHFWDNLCNGVESIQFFSDEEVAAAGVDPALVKHPDYVKAWGTLDGIENFDANFFGIPGREAEAMDPQHRLFMEVCAHALDNAGYNPETYEGYIGCISGVGMSTYLLRHLIPNSDKLQTLGEFLVFLGNDKDFMPTRVSYKLNLRGPSHSVSTGCSTTLVATHLACRQLLSYQTDIALAGGANIKVPQKAGYLYRKGQLKSPDGRCRAFDAKARGTVFGNGVAVVALKRLKDALADGDHIYAVIKGSAINNDGSSKAAFTAPSVQGQAEVIAEAHAIADFPFDTITYMEAHGTGTELGDPVEIKSLNQVFREGKNATDKKQYCAMASVKTNIGHVDNVAGVTGLIKTALCLDRKQIPPSLNFEEPNPEIDFANSPFYINTELKDWDIPEGMPRRACVSAFGAGGTNAHAVLEEAPPREPSGPSRPWQLLTVAAKTPTAIEAYIENLANHFEAHPDINVADAVFTMNVGRPAFAHRRAFLVKDAADAVAVLRGGDPARAFGGAKTETADERRDEIARGVKRLADAGADEAALKDALAELGRLWVEGATMDWDAFYAGERRHRLPMPGYPFEGKRYWLDEPERGVAMENLSVNLYKEPDIADWFYAPSWWSAPLPLRKAGEPQADRCMLIFADDLGLGDQLAERLRALGWDAVTVKRGDDFDKQSDQAYVINGMDPNHYNGLLTEMQNRGKSPDTVVHLWALAEPHYGDVFARAETALNNGFFSLVALAQGIGAQSYAHRPQLIVGGSRLFKVNRRDRLDLESSVIGPLRVIPQEYKHMDARGVDLELPPADERQGGEWVDQLLAEIFAESHSGLVAYRDGERFLESVAPVRMAPVDDHPLFKQGGVYLITGGLGGIGLAVAQFLAREYGAKLILTGRSEIPARDQWERWLAEHDPADRTSRKINALLDLEQAGGQVLALQANVADYDRMKAVVAEARQQFGAVNGVVHAAGAPESGVIQRKTFAQAAEILSPKVQGTLVLHQLFADEPLDFLCLASSLASLMGGVGQVAYVAGNAFMDAYAREHDRPERRVISLNWDAWREVGMTVNLDVPEELRDWHEERLMRLGIAPEEGQDAFARALANRFPQVYVSTHNLSLRVKHQAQLVDQEIMRALKRAGEKHAVYPRPEMSVDYVPPRNELEGALARVWSDMLGIDKVGVDDDFFELGGDSLKGMNLVNRLEKEMGETMNVDALFETPTVAMLAEFVEAQYPEGSARMLGGGAAEPAKPKDAGASAIDPSIDEKVDAMSSEEVDAMLNKLMNEQ